MVIAKPVENIGMTIAPQMTSSEARAKMYEVVAAVERGETITITRYGKVVAEIGPPRETDRKSP